MSRRPVRPAPPVAPITGRGRLADLPSPAALLFDLDGTLVDTVGIRIEAWLRAFGEAAIPARPEQVAPLIGSDGRRLAREIAAGAGQFLAPGEDEQLDTRAGELHEALNVEPRPLRGAAALLRALATSALPHAIATSSRPEQVLTSVDALGLARRPTIVDGGHVEHAKPAPDLLLLAAARLTLPPARCWYVGDATWDMLAALAAGMVPIGVPSGAVDAAALTAAGAAVVVADLVALHRELARRQLVGTPLRRPAACR